ncbi:PREDICTED: regulator of nonsense transcripts 2 [Nicrophorus vespilloides]|uniref:Regulator of nonsense transcripts 2 n=1 Tax=Nicrophorus vespilloides TaxID=110193 RepID=A0ABM1MTQ3_NICVS|nr:PREDICTED: regulator of nonsense transcripts 2 [Nicrophorus vespilloides]
MTILEGASNDVEVVNNEDEEKKVLETFILEATERITSKAELRNVNQNAGNNRPSDNHFTKLDSSLKKNTAFVKKIRNFSSTQIDVYLKDMSGLNLTKYISEIAAAIVDSKLKMTDVAAAVKMCCILHQTYSDFSQHLFENWQKILNIKTSDKINNPSKLRVDLRFYAELVNVNIFNNKTAFSLLGNVLLTLINMDKEEHLNISIVLSFCRHCGDEYAGLVPRKIHELANKYKSTIPKSDFLPPEKQQNVKSLLKDYFTSLSKHLVKDHIEMQDFEKQNYRILQTKGELSQERKDKLESLQISYDKLITAAQNFSEILDENMPELRANIITKDEENMVVTGAGVDFDGDGSNVANGENIWCDSETQRFYCELPELQAFLPTSMINKSAPKPEAESEVTEEVLDSELPAEELEEEDTKVEDPPVEDEVEDTSSITVSNKIVLEAFLNNLPNCVNREMIDNAAIDFLVTLNTKHNRRKLVRSLFSVNRTRLDLLPFYARFVAILYPALPEIANDLCQMLRQDFKYHVRKKDQINIESKIKVVRYIGELVKFNLYSKIEALYCLKVLLHDFSHHHIEMACNLLEVCGHFLFCLPESHQRTKVYLEQMMRKKAVMALDSRYVTQIENAYYYVNPPDLVAVAKKERPPMHQFLRKLLYQDLQKTNTDKILRLIRKLNWSDDDTAAYAIKCLTGAHNMKYFNIRCLANLLAGLVAYQDEVGTKVVDGVLEDIRLGMEVNSPKFNQRRVAQVKYLGELYNYRIVESTDIFKVLYSLISFGVSMDSESPSILDPPNHLFRIRLACVLLETCGMYFSSGSSKRKLDYFLTFFQAYYWFKHSLWGEAFPPPLEHLFKDTLNQLRPKLKLCTSYEDSQKEIMHIKRNLGISDHMQDDETKGDGLEIITETDNEEQGEDEVSDCVTAPITTDDTATEDETVDNTQGSDEEVDRDNSDMDQQDQQGVASEIEAIPSGPRKVECKEDDEFLNALDKMVSENIQERMRETVKASHIDISVPVLKSNKKNYDQLQETGDKDQNTMGFVLMVRKGNKQQYKPFEADINSELAQNLRDQELAQREEKMKVKRLTLNISERFEEEDFQEMMQQQSRPVTQNLNRERKKYQHPKGAPDADLIFGKRVR